MRSIRVSLTMLVGGLACLVIASAIAQEGAGFPGKTVRLLHAAPAGSGVDIFARALAQELMPMWKQTVIVEARPGANGLISSDACAKGHADGHTLCIRSRSEVSLLPHVQPKLPFDTERDFVLIARLFDSVSALFANAQVPIASVRELVEHASKRGGTLNFATPSETSISHILMEALRKSHGIEMTSVPYKGVVPMVQAVVSGETQLTYIGLAPTLGSYRAGKVKALAQNGEKRSTLLPDVPTFKEAGLGDVDGGWWFGLFAPKGLADDAVRRVHADLVKLYVNPAFVQQRLESQGWIPALLGPREFAEFVSRDRATMREQLRRFDMLPK